MKTKCLICGRMLRDTFAEKWKHALRIHPDIAFSKLVPLLSNPGAARSAGFEAGRMLRARLLNGK